MLWLDGRVGADGFHRVRSPHTVYGTTSAHKKVLFPMSADTVQTTSAQHGRAPQVVTSANCSLV
jgi:hypothetical protein